MVALDFNAPTAKERAEMARRKVAITRRVKREVLAELGIEELPSQGERTLITGAQGTGKSSSAADEIADLPPGAVIWWLVPTLGKAEEQVADYTRRAQPNSMPACVVRGPCEPRPATRSARKRWRARRAADEATKLG
jgi:hypothetical protein